MPEVPYFRPGAGAVIFNSMKEVLVFKRNDSLGWQFPQGGMDKDEDIERTLWRELYEETGLARANFTSITAYPEWTIYAYPKETLSAFSYKLTLGQAHRWFFLELKEGTVIDLSLTKDKEFSDWRWSTFAKVIPETVLMKQPVYQDLSDYFCDPVFESKIVPLF